MKQASPLAYEHAAEQVTVTGWICRTCRKYYADSEHIARYCCSSEVPCQAEGCGGKAKKGWAYCESCREKRDRERYLKRPEQDWDGKTPLVADGDDRYFYDTDEIRDYLAEHAPLDAEDLRLVICRPVSKPVFEMSDLFSDYFPDDMSLEGDPKDVEQAVNGWIAANVPTVWEPGSHRPTLASIKEALS